MRLRNMIIGLGALAAVAALPAAAAEGCLQAENEMRAEAAILGPMLTQLDQIVADYNSAEQELDEVYAYADEYGWDDDADYAAWDLEDWLYTLEGEHADLLPKVNEHDVTLKEKVNAYEAACGSFARTTEVLAEYQIIRN